MGLKKITSIVRGVPKINGPVSGIPVIRIIVYWDIYFSL